MSEAEPRRLITTIERAADVLMLFATADQADLGVTEISRELGLSKAVVHRVLTTLTAKGFVEVVEDSRRYRLGPAVLSLGVAYLDRIDVRALAAPALHRLSEATNETATLSLRYGWERMYVDQVTPDREVKMTVALGRPFPLHAGGSSKAFLAFLPEVEQEEYIAGRKLSALTDRTIVDPDALRRELREVRARGYALSFGERQAGAGSIASPVIDHRGRPVAVISVCGPLERLRDEVDDVVAVLLSTTADLSHRLGHTSSPAEPEVASV
ncbi:IclR family transcriptional regulator [Egicoccus sp. AB-alg2]|uniref:IclR family transcriptional regulator n=1 Tax=Egicoccus sp. AB-alg2 TaxID=3242693 RepID=UPI00359CC841